MHEPPIRARMVPGGDQVVEITIDHGYRPRSIVARADLPLRLIFQRSDADVCSERVIFSSPHFERHLAPHGATTIVLPAQPAGEVRFTCGMGRYRGQIVLKSDVRVSLIDRIREEASRHEGPIGTAVVLWLCSLPLIALLAVLILDPGAAVIAALFAFPAWIAGCLGASRRSRGSIEQARREDVLR